MFHFLRLGKRTWYGDWLRSCLDKNSVIVYWILNNWLDDCVRNMGIFSKFAITQLVHMNSVFVRMTLEAPLLVCMIYVNLLLAFVNLHLVRTNSLELCESPARTHEFS